ncbi:MAG TPA: UbiA prenyltransferase family protein [Candidatus Bathyarchaeia archaeon]|nr:UbiA prenyltransferase family protein [Candidatus Bathyarchaeia archaeon]
MVKLFYELARAARPRQTIKNLALFAALIFTGNLFVPENFLTVFKGFLIFSLLTSSKYIFNDIIDLSWDQRHPVKKNRPIASGALPLPIALFASIAGCFTSLYLAAQLPFFFFLTCLAYFLLQIAYNFLLKNIVILDALAIAAGFILRVYAGAFVLDVHLSVWFLLCIISLSLFLAVGKRRAELALLASQKALHPRKTLALYKPELLNSYLSMFGSATWLSYALFTFFAPGPPIAKRLAFWDRLPLTLAGVNKWLMLTIPLVIFGIMRYMQIIYSGAKAEAPEKVLLSDKPLLLTVAAWGIAVILIIYGVS